MRRFKRFARVSRVLLRLCLLVVCLAVAGELVLRAGEFARYGTIVCRAQIQEYVPGIGYRSIPNSVARASGHCNT